MRICVVLLSLVLVVHPVKADDAERSCREFLSHLIPVHRVSNGSVVAFTGRFKAIPGSLERDLTRAFPEIEFRIAEMTYLHWGPDPVNLLLVLDRKTSEVETFLWDVWFTEEPFSFRTKFDQRDAPSRKTAIDRMAVLARLVCFQMGWQAGEVRVEDDVLLAPLINNDGRIWRVIRTRITPHLDDEFLSIVPPETGRTKPQ